MGSGGAVQYFTILLLYLLLNSGPSVAERPSLESIQESSLVGYQEHQMFYPSSVSTTQLDTTGGVPIINPTTPGTTPIVNPTPTDSPPTPIGITPIPTTPPATTNPNPNPPTTTNPNPPTTMNPNPPTTMNPPANTNPTSSGGSWCIASPVASQTALQVALDYACGYGGADCSAIQQGASCYNSNTVRDHASYAFNSYYQKNPIPTSCVFGGTAQLTNTDPSNGNCHYPSGTTTTSITPPANATPTIPSPMIPTPMIPTAPGGPTIYGVPEPTGQPSSATSISCSSLLLISATGFASSLLAAKHL